MFSKKCCISTAEDSDFCHDSEFEHDSCCSHSGACKPFYKRWWFWTVTGIAVISSVAALLYWRDKQFYKKILDLIS